MSLLPRIIWGSKGTACSPSLSDFTREKQWALGAFCEYQFEEISSRRCTDRCSMQTFARGFPIGEFVGEITRCIRGKDVMQGGIPPNQYQIYQGVMGKVDHYDHFQATY